MVADEAALALAIVTQGTLFTKVVLTPEDMVKQTQAQLCGSETHLKQQLDDVGEILSDFGRAKKHNLPTAPKSEGIVQHHLAVTHLVTTGLVNFSRQM